MHFDFARDVVKGGLAHIGFHDRSGRYYAVAHSRHFMGLVGDGGDARGARFGGDPDAEFDGPISLSVDETGNIHVGDRFNRVVRMIDRRTGGISTIAGSRDALDAMANDADERDPLRVHLPKISSMEFADYRLFVPTDLTAGAGDLAVLRGIDASESGQEAHRPHEE